MRFTGLLWLTLTAAWPKTFAEEHAGDAIAWQAFGPAAVAAAREAGQPVLISIGTAGCPACRRQAAESFRDPALAAVINEGFIPLLLDADADPGAAEHLLRAARRLGAPSTWPLNLFLTPELEPYLAVGYLPLEAAPPGPSWREVAARALTAWRQQPDEVRTRAAELRAELELELALPDPAPLADSVRDQAVARLKSLYDDQHGGFGTDAKPLPALELAFLLRESVARHDRVLLRMVTGTVDPLAASAVHDPLGGWFAGSLDRAGRAPVLEKGLADNAQMAGLLLDLAVLTGEPRFRDLGEATLLGLVRDFRLPEGALAVRARPDPEHLEPWLSPHDPPTAEDLIVRRLAVDPRVVAADSALAIGALAQAAQRFGTAAWRGHATTVGQRTWELLTGPDGLRHEATGGLAGAADLGLLANALIDLYETTFDRLWLARADALLAQADATLREGDAPYAAWPQTPLVRPDRRAIDRAMPSGNAALARALLRRYRLTEDPPLRARAEQVVAAAAAAAAAQPVAHLGLLKAARWLNQELPAVTVIGTREAAAPLLAVGWTGYWPERLLAWLDPAAPDAATAIEQIPLFGNRGPGKHGARAYVCQDGACLRPVDQPDELREQLTALTD